LPDHHQVRLLIEEVGDAPPHQLVVIDQEHLEHGTLL
jgi:hypothetical protein